MDTNKKSEILENIITTIACTIFAIVMMVSLFIPLIAYHNCSNNILSFIAFCVPLIFITLYAIFYYIFGNPTKKDKLLFILMFIFAFLLIILKFIGAEEKYIEVCTVTIFIPLWQTLLVRGFPK